MPCPATCPLGLGRLSLSGSLGVFRASFGGPLNNRTMIPRLRSLSRKLMKEKFHQFLNYPFILLYNFYDLVVFEFIRLFYSFSASSLWKLILNFRKSFLIKKANIPLAGFDLQILKKLYNLFQILRSRMRVFPEFFIHFLLTSFVLFLYAFGNDFLHVETYTLDQRICYFESVQLLGLPLVQLGQWKVLDKILKYILYTLRRGNRLIM